MAIRVNDPEYRRSNIGMPDSHAEKFKQIAHDLNCVILCRAVGPTCLQPLEHGYDTKGFRVHGKSCDWGPMAGFVLRDPRLNKSGTGKEGFNREEHHIAMTDHNHAGWSAGTTALKLYPDRVRWLMRQGLIRVQHVNANKVTERWEGEAVHSSGVHFHYALIKERSNDGLVFGVYFDAIRNHRLGFRQEVSLPRPPLFQLRFEPMMAMTNPEAHRSWPNSDFRNAITGDYDLFGVWPMLDDYDADDMDRRILGTAHVLTHADEIDRLERNFTTVHDAPQATKIGNITNRIYEVCQFLNSAIAFASSAETKTYGPFPRRMVCWHSDESARPGVQDVDLPFIVFTPTPVEACITSIPDFVQFIQWAKDNRVHVSLAEGWTAAPTTKYPNRLGLTFRKYVPTFAGGDAWNIPDWYNK